MSNKHSESTPQTLNTLIAELRKKPTFVTDTEVLALLDALEAMRSQRDGLANIVGHGTPKFVLADLDAKIARVLREDK